MKKVHIWFHKDGDKLTVVEVPWWSDIFEWTANKLLSPCCGLSGFLSRIDKVEYLFYAVWAKALEITYKREKELYSVPIEDGCLVTQKIWDTKVQCFRDNCEHCWEYGDDVYKEEVSSMT